MRHRHGRGGAGPANGAPALRLLDSRIRGNGGAREETQNRSDSPHPQGEKDIQSGNWVTPRKATTFGTPQPWEHFPWTHLVNGMH